MIVKYSYMTKILYDDYSLSVINEYYELWVLWLWVKPTLDGKIHGLYAEGTFLWDCFKVEKKVNKFVKRVVMGLDVPQDLRTRKLLTE